MESPLSLLKSFNVIAKKNHIPELFGDFLVQQSRQKELVTFSRPIDENGAKLYGDIIGVKNIQVESTNNPLEEAIKCQNKYIALIVENAENPNLRQVMFSNPGSVSLFVDHNYVPQGDNKSPRLQTIGTNSALMNNFYKANLSAVSAESNRLDALKANLGNNLFPYQDFRKLLQSSYVTKIRVHALGPDGTNISQVAKQYVQKHNLSAKAEIIIHPSGVEPMEYADIAAQELSHGVIPLHIECAVYYDMGRLYRQRINELVFADHYYMPLDEMQLAANYSGHDLSAILDSRTIKIASHPSPESLVLPWTQTGKAEIVKASSNTNAAEMVRNGEVDACITTEQGRLKNELQQVFSFGSPMMIFTIGTPLSNKM